MKPTLKLQAATLATAAISTLSSLIPFTAPANAYTFGQQEVTQSKFAVVAVPGYNNTRNLLIIEQKSNERPCWSESGSAPVRVDPLLLNFNFDGICGRSVDSNGYSLRMGGEDLALDYSLRVVNRGDDIVLMARNNRDRNAPEVQIGRTYGVINDFSKIQLNPGWRLTKRTYNGQSLGHVYLTNDLTLAAYTGSNPGSGSGSGSGTGNPSKFPDIASDIYAKEIDEAVTMGIIAGFPEDNTFRPQGTLTREQIVSMVVEGISKQLTQVSVLSSVTGRPYPDVESSRWSAAKIKFARDNGIIRGYPDGSFRPNQAVTRAELISILQGAAEFIKEQRGLSPELNPTQTPATFSDTGNHWASSSIREMSGFCKVASPVNEAGNSFAPDTSARRNYAAAATLRMLKCVQ